MSFLANSLPFESETRMTYVWTKSREEDQRKNSLVTVHLILIDEDQDYDVESTIITSFLPFQTGGFSGVDRHGRPWIVIIQHSQYDDHERARADMGNRHDAGVG